MQWAGNKASSYGGAILARCLNDGCTAKTTINSSTFKNNTASIGGALFGWTNSDTVISGSTFDSNTAQFGGAIYTATTMKNIAINDTEFSNNSAESVGAVGIFASGSLNNVTFKNNEATNASYDGAGALFLGSVSQTKINNSTFTDNTSAAVGGAIAMRATNLGNNVNADLDVLNSTFTRNKAATKGGAIFSTFYSSDKYVDSVYISGSTFNQNEAAQGAAIYNEGVPDKGGNLAVMKIENSTFDGNIASSAGGAIYNAGDGTIHFEGTNTFTNNTANGVKNDIHNDGTLNVSGLLALDGGITGTGTVNFMDGSSLKAALNSETAIITAGTITGQTALVFENGSEGGTIKLDGTQDTFSFTDNALYDMTSDNGTYTFTKKDAAGIAEATGATGTAAEAVAAVTAGTSDNEGFNAVAENINTMLQSSDAGVVAAGVQAAKALAPVEAPVIQAQTTQTVSQILAAAGSRLSGGSTVSMGESSGDFALGKGSVWAKGLYNKSKYSGTDGFDAYSRGIALGAEAQITDSVKVGLGYAYTNSDIKPDLRKTDIDSNSALLYGEYKPNNWYVNGIASYTWGRYDEHRYATTDVSGKYDVNTIALQAMTGYDIHMDALTFTPEAGLRYMNIDQKAYTDSIGSHIAGNSSDIFTGVLGAKAVYDWNITDNILLKPEVRAAITYDFVRDNATAVMSLANGSVIATDSKALKRFGTEFAVGLTTDIADNLEMGIFWEGKFRNDYTDNTGMINVKYNF